MKKKTAQIVQPNNALLNVISPMGIEFKKSSMYLGESLGKIYGIVRYPQKPEYGYLADITNLQSTLVSISFKPVESGDFVETLSRNIVQKRGEVETLRDPLSKNRAEKSAKDSEKVMVHIDQHGESVGLMGTVVMPLSRDEEVFNKVMRKTETKIISKKCKARVLSDNQEPAFKNLSPFYTLDPTIDQIIDRPVPLSSFIGGFPFSSSGYNDGTGYHLGKDASGGLIIIDPWKRGGDRTNTNFVIMGVPGVGKSTVIKSIAMSEYMKGTKVIFIDPEREYKELCNNLDGDWINCGGGSLGRVNPLQIRPVPLDDEEENEILYKDEGQGMGDMALHMKTLEVFFSLYIPSLNDNQKAILKRCIIELYNLHGIKWDTDVSKLEATDFPIFSDLHNLIKKRSKEYRAEKMEMEASVCDSLALLLEDIAIGSDSFLWNGHSSIQTNTNCICLDTRDLQNTSDSVKRTQYFNILTWAWQQMSADRNEKVLLLCDEAYLMIDPNVPQSLIFLRNVEKRSRKYESGVGIISHSVVDFLSESIKMYGQALLDVPCYKILMGTDGKNLQETKQLYKLTDAEEELLASKKRGQSLLMIGSKRLNCNFEGAIPEYKLDLMGKAGGR